MDGTTAHDRAKQALRGAASAARRARRADNLATARAQLCAVVLAQVDTLRPTCVAGYEPLATEPGSLQLLEELRARDIRVLVPITLADRDLQWREWPDGPPLARTAIADAQLVLVPALAVDRRGTRLGRGGGSYDRALPRTSATTAALLFDGEWVDELLPHAPWDVQVNAVACPRGWYKINWHTMAGEHQITRSEIDEQS